MNINYNPVEEPLTCHFCRDTISAHDDGTCLACSDAEESETYLNDLVFGDNE